MIFVLKAYQTHLSELTHWFYIDYFLHMQSKCMNPLNKEHHIGRRHSAWRNTAACRKYGCHESTQNDIAGIEGIYIKCGWEARSSLILKTNGLEFDVVEYWNSVDWFKEQIWSSCFNLKKKEKSRNCFHFWLPLSYIRTHRYNTL